MKRSSIYAIRAVIFIFFLLFINIDLFAQEQRKHFKINDIIGDTIDKDEREAYNLFESIDGFQFACFYLRDGKYLDAKVHYIENGIPKDTLIRKYSVLNGFKDYFNNILPVKDKTLKKKKKIKFADKRDQTRTVIFLKNGTSVKGSIVRKTADSVYLSADILGLLAIYLVEIDSIREVFVKQEENPEYDEVKERRKSFRDKGELDPVQNRTFIMPTAYTPKAGHGNFGLYEISMINCDVSLTDRIMVNGGTLLLGLFSLGVKANIYEKQDSYAVGLGCQILSMPMKNYFPKVAYGVFTKGDKFGNINVLLGGSLDWDKETKYTAFIGLSGNLQWASFAKFMAEVYYSPNWDYLPILFGLRFFGAHFSCDLGIMNQIKNHYYGYQTIPVVSIFYSF